MVKRLYAVKHNYSATSNPLVTDDSSKLYSVGSQWYNGTASLLWACASNAVGAASWELVNNTVNTNTSVVTVTNTVAETDLINFTVPANTLKTNSILMLNYGGKYLNNSGGNSTVRFRCYFGGTLAADSIASSNIATNANAKGFLGEFRVANQTTSIQNTSLKSNISSLAFSTAGTLSGLVFGATAINTAAEVIVRVTVTHSVANAKITTTKFYHTMWIL